MTEFKDMLKYFRNREGLSQAQLAKSLGLSASTISMYEVGSREPDFETEEKIADFFNTDLNTLRGRDIEANLVLSPDAAALLDDYQKLNADGKQEVRNHMDYVRSQERFNKDTGSSERKMA